MRISPERIYLFVTLLVSGSVVSAQTSVDSLQLQAAIKSVVATYRTATEDHSNLYNGAEYIGYERGIVGHQYFLQDNFANGDIFYGNTLYTNVPLLYDIVRDEIVINLYKRDFRIKLLNEKIDHFTIGNKRFERIDPGGFFEVLYKGKATALAKRVKRIINSLNTEEPSRFITLDKLFVFTNNNYFPVDDRSSLLKAFADKKNLVRQFVESKKFNFKKDLESAIIQTTAYYSSLNN
jgi:hypothetical protein